MLRKITIIIFTIALAVIFAGTALADTSSTVKEKPPEGSGAKYTYISSTATNLNINSIGKAYCDAQIHCYSGVDSVRISGYLERYSNGSWTTLKQWTDNTSGNYGQMNKEWYVARGYQYRWRVYYYAYEGSDSESTSKIVYENFY